MKTRHYLVRGAWLSVAIALCAIVALAVVLGISYDGTCGGFMQFLAAAKPCSFIDYVFTNLTLMALILGIKFWPAIIVVLASPMVVGYIRDRRRLQVATAAGNIAR